MKITVRNLSHIYAHGIRALTGVDLSVEAGEGVLILGRNGAGKSTLLKHLNGILKPTSGDVLLGEVNTKSRDVSEMAHHVALSFQNPDDQIFESTVLDEVAFGPKNTGKSDHLQLAEGALKLLRIEDLATSHPYDLHPSARKMLTIASAIAMDTPIVAFDEPSAGLDRRQREVLGRALEWLKERNKTIICVTHDINFALNLCDSVLLLDQGKVVFHGAKEKFGSRTDLRQVLRKSGLTMPMLWRMAQAVGLDQMPSSTEEFGKLLFSRSVARLEG